MTANLEFTTAKKMIETNEVRRSISVVDYHVLRLEESFDQIENIFRLNVSENVKNEAYTYLEKIDKLIKIADDLKTRFKSLRPLRIAHATPRLAKYDLAQLIIELDLLNEMHFRLKKSCFSFINKHYIRKQVSKSMVA